jgi:hypothetical protein
VLIRKGFRRGFGKRFREDSGAIQEKIQEGLKELATIYQLLIPGRRPTAA